MKKIGVGAIALMVLMSSLASAQRTPARARSAPAQQRSLWELGLDAALGFNFDTPRTTILSIPAGIFRAGYFVNDQLSLEPFFGLNHIGVQNGGSVTTYQLGLGGLYHLSTSRAQKQIYVRPFLDLVGVSTSGGGSNSDIGVGVGAGLKWPKLAGRMAVRTEANIAAVNGNTSLNFLLGLSFFTR